jgi:hypothetical protein
MNNLLLGAHIVSGALGIALGPVVMWRETQLLRTGKPAHSSAGRIYQATVMLICLSATALVINSRPDLWWLIPVAAVSYALALLGRVAGTRRFHGWTHAYVHGIGGSYIALATALVVVAVTVDGPVKGGPISVVPWVTPAALGTVLIESWRRRLTRDPADVSTAARAGKAAGTSDPQRCTANSGRANHAA